ncbi:MAG: rhodanese-like domain-containing protein [Bacteroidales bacterium]|nr:rhodanese-like domain-containing protein [Bacteroidales bacterium]
MKSIFVISLFLFLLTGSLNSQITDSLKYKSLEPYDFHLQYLRIDCSLLIDVREFFEFKRSRIRDAINIPSSGNIEVAADTLDKDYALFLYCTTGYRSKRASELLSEKGFRRLYNLEGGIVAWKKDGMPVEKGRPAHNTMPKVKRKK